ncbi:NUDIX hydrolase [Lactococcus nasutitermitis]|uniref:NUDIX hydrolase n=1 Tax=Lactococcus nasutitermitis TaxID=1652957 RepID=A0ABV9JED1_9LACT|nr:NUDIX hydrolase [Lactococcus nasutitermitis]
MTEIPTFGEKIDGKNYEARYGVYAVVSRETDGKICLVQTPNGAFYLPGGEIEAGENQEIALKRELIEELGADMEIGDFLGQADEYFYSSHRNRYYYNPAYIYSLASVKFDHTPLEDFNKICWFDSEEAIDKLKRGSHKWGIETWKKRFD